MVRCQLRVECEIKMFSLVSKEVYIIYTGMIDSGEK